MSNTPTGAAALLGIKSGKGFGLEVLLTAEGNGVVAAWDDGRGDIALAATFSFGVLGSGVVANKAGTLYELF